MKIEKINDHTIRCTLTREDLADRQLKLSELAYGTEKAKDLFRDMMQQASFQFGFEADDIPLMIEAIPLNSECIVLMITKVEDPEELDTRFSKFAPSVQEDAALSADTIEALAEGADDVLDLFRRIQNRQNTKEPAVSEPAKKHKSGEAVDASSIREAIHKKLREADGVELTRIYRFETLRDVMRMSRVLSGFYCGTNSLYRNTDDAYILVLSGNGHTPAEFNKACNILSEYGSALRTVPASEAYLEEHFEPILKGDAIKTLAAV